MHDVVTLFYVAVNVDERRKDTVLRIIHTETQKTTTTVQHSVEQFETFSAL